LDMSGSEQGAGGVGGLVATKLHTGAKAGTYFTVMDGNGNVMGLVNAANGITRAEYAYGPFGEPLRATGLLANDNPFRFSSKYLEPESGLLYYGHRFYNPSTGRWLSRDPIGEEGGLNLYAHCANDLRQRVDYLGLDYIVVTTEGKCKTHHKWIYGDDGNGGSFTLEFAPVVDTWWQSYRRFCGKGRYSYTPYSLIPLDDLIANNADDIITVDRRAETSAETDRAVNAAASMFDGLEAQYCLGFLDCRTIESDCQLMLRLQSEEGNQAAQDALDQITGAAGNPDTDGPPVIIP